MWFELKGDERLKRCASDECGGQPTWRLESDGVGSNYCSGCREKIEEEAIMASLQNTFGYRPRERSGEKWVVYQDHSLIVIHPSEKPRIYTRGCAGSFYEIEPIFPY